MNQIAIHNQNISGATRDDQLVALWLSGRPGTTSRAYRADILRFYQHTRKPLSGITATDLVTYAETLAGAGLQPASQYRMLSAVKSLFGYAHRLGYIQANPSAALRMPKPVHDRAAKLVSREAVVAVIDSAKTTRDRLLCLTLYYLGLRESELISLRRGNLSPDGVSVTGKGHKLRHIAAPSDLLQALAAHCGECTSDAPIFRSVNGNALSPSDVYRIVVAAGKRAGHDITPHMLRHAHASHALDNGAPLHVVKETLGHASLSTTSIYAHAKPGDGSAMYLEHPAGLEPATLRFEV